MCDRVTCDSDTVTGDMTFSATVTGHRVTSFQWTECRKSREKCLKLNFHASVTSHPALRNGRHWKQPPVAPPLNPPLPRCNRPPPPLPLPSSMTTMFAHSPSPTPHHRCCTCSPQPPHPPLPTRTLTLFSQANPRTCSGSVVWWCARHAAERAIWPRRVVALKVPAASAGSCSVALTSLLKHRHLQPVPCSYGRSEAASGSCKPSSARAHLSFVSLPHKVAHSAAILGPSSGRVGSPAAACA